MTSVEFSRPKSLEGYRCVDMHFHTTHSDGAATVEQILGKIRTLKIGVAVTDHTTISGSLEIFRKKSEKDFVIPGVEINSEERVDVLFYFYDIEEMKSFYKKEILPNRVRMLRYFRSTLSLPELHKLSKKYNCVTSVAHPYGYTMRGGSNRIFEKNENELKKFDAVEAINGGTSRKNNRRAVDYIKQNLKSYTGGSDGHSIYPLGNVLTCSKANTVKEFLDNIKNKKNHVIGKELRFNKFSEYFYYGKNKIKNIFSK
ncbi:TPA: hypothetical protein HA239_00835 [Candidatus Woesearchaeota archaeon]|nr:PHP-like protein [archaeon GW2011_AR15]MBS3103993.1 hypothetical protein [Candidatus Woesearchaeota archaeon]HIH40939.1 hypothetical protein [Candidatus Woesearchaeota archaeon]